MRQQTDGITKDFEAMSHPHRRDFLRRSASAALAGANYWTASRSRAAEPVSENATIAEARRAAMDVLQPKPRELEHGLELHAESIVFDAYGFAPRAALDSDAINRAIEAGASDAELQDLREDQGMTRCVTSQAERTEFMEAWNAAGMTCIFQNAGEEGQDPLRLMKRLARFTYVTDVLGDFVRKAVTPDDVLKAKREGRHCLAFSGNGVPIAQQWVSVEEELSYVRIFFQLGIRMMHLTYNRRNMIGDGCAEPANAGLSDFGRQAVAEMNRVGVIADVAHSGWQTSLEAAQVSKRPMVASHTACAGLHMHIRNKPVEVIKAIADTGGYAGICCIPSFLGGDGDLKALLDHIDYAVQRFGADHVAIGTDIAYTSRNTAAANQKIARAGKSRTRWEALWPPGSLGGKYPKSLSLAWTNWPMYTVGLVQRGYKDDDIQKILGGNVLRVCRAALETT